MDRLTYDDGVNALLLKDGEQKHWHSVCYGCSKLPECAKENKTCNLFKAIENLAAYERTGMLPEEIKNLKWLQKKQKPRKLKKIALAPIKGIKVNLHCPECGKWIMTYEGEATRWSRPNYCSECGQALLRSRKEDYL